MKVTILSSEYEVFELWVKQPHRLMWELRATGPGAEMLELANKLLLGEV